MKLPSALALSGALLGLCPAVFAEPAVTVRAIDLRQAPASDARAVASLPANTTVDIARREGAWVQLTAGTSTGWAKLFDVRLATSRDAPAKSGSGASISQTLQLASGARGTTVTTGVRGLDEEMLRNSTPNMAALTALDGHASTRPEAESFARAGQLQPRNVDPLKAADASAFGAKR
jgi:hypothetical protein